MLDCIGAGGAGDATAQQGLVGGQLSRERRDVDDIRNCQAPARLEHAEGLAVNLRLVGHEVDHAIRDDHVGGIVGDRQMLDLTEAELDIGGPGPSGVAGLFQHLVGHVDTDDAACHADLLRCEKAIEPGAAAEIDDDFAGPHCRDRLRVAAAEAEIGALGYRGQLCCRIAHSAGDLFRRPGAAAAAHRPFGNRGIAAAHELLDLLPVHHSLAEIRVPAIDSEHNPFRGLAINA